MAVLFLLNFAANVVVDVVSSVVVVVVVVVCMVAPHLLTDLQKPSVQVCGSPPSAARTKSHRLGESPGLELGVNVGF